MPTETKDESPVPEVITCYECDKVLETADEVRNNHNYCQDCYDEEYLTSCNSCGDSIDVDDVYEDDGDSYCNNCYNDRQNDNDYEINERSFSNRNIPELQSIVKGKYITSRRIFSAELECYYNSSDDMSSAECTLPRSFGVSGDGSLNDNGVEFQTPKLKGKAGEEAIVQTCKTLNGLDFYTDHTCGLHIHLDGRGLLPKTSTKDRPKALIEAIGFYFLFEDIIVSFLPKSRRNNRYCQSLANCGYFLNDIQKCTNLDELEHVWYQSSSKRDIDYRKKEKYDSTRYAGFNVHSLLNNKHAEIRYHSGTLNEVKILEWVNLHQTILDKACKTSIVNMTAIDLPLDKKTDMFFSILALPKRAEKYFRERQSLFSQEMRMTENDSLNQA